MWLLSVRQMDRQSIRQQSYDRLGRSGLYEIDRGAGDYH